MKIAVTIWGNRISPVFDAAKRLLVVEIADGEIVCQATRTFVPTRFDLFQQLLKEMDVHLLICGAICKFGITRLEEIGVEVVPFITGEVGRVLEHYISGEEFTEFAMPGCRTGCCRGGEARPNEKTAGFMTATDDDDVTG